MFLKLPLYIQEYRALQIGIAAEGSNAMRTTRGKFAQELAGYLEMGALIPEIDKIC